jgi:hypothetical protein
LGLSCLEICELTSLRGGGLLVTLDRAKVDGQKLLVLVTNVTLKSPQLLVQGTMLLINMPDLLLKGCDLPCISIETAALSSNDTMGVMLQLEHVLGMSRHVCPSSMVVVLEDVALLVHA